MNSITKEDWLCYFSTDPNGGRVAALLQESMSKQTNSCFSFFSRKEPSEDSFPETFNALCEALSDESHKCKQLGLGDIKLSEANQQKLRDVLDSDLNRDKQIKVIGDLRSKFDVQAGPSNTNKS